MIETIIASLLGFAGSIVPEFFKISQDKRDKEHEISILNMQIQQAASEHAAKLEEINVHADISESKALYKTYHSGVQWVDALNATVRPVIAYAFFLLYAVIKACIIYTLIVNDIPLLDIVEPASTAADALPWQKLPSINVNWSAWGAVWSREDQIIFATIISFYYGQRAMQKIRGNK